MMKRLKSYISYEDEVILVAALAFVFCGAVLPGFR
jgi:hypothetical protein